MAALPGLYIFLDRCSRHVTESQPSVHLSPAKDCLGTRSQSSLGCCPRLHLHW